MTRLTAALLALLLAAAGTPVPARAAGGDFSQHAVGTAGSEFLNVDVDARGMAMGGAYSALTNDAYAMFWNPAGLAMVPRVSLGAMHTEYLAGIRLQYLSYAHRANESSVFAGAVRYMDGGAIDNTDVSGNKIGTFHPRNYVYEVGWGQSITDLADAERDITLGVSMKYLNSDLIAHADGWAGDIGMQAHYTDTLMPFKFSAVAQNFGRGQKFDKVRDTLPFRGKLGASLQPRSALTLAMEAFLPVSNAPYGALGAELMLEGASKAKAFLRVGYNSRTTFSGLEGIRGVTAGLGLRIADFSVDYAFVPFGILGQTHRLGLTWTLPAKHARRFRER
ncbi:MAG: PorV/PorQ family protein [Elusimicrobia bacterium]|nr:PorV/PorQ family protein [Elusimicrobiota bacterium]